MPPYKPDYRRVADDLREQIQDGRLRAGAKLPTKREMCAQYEVSSQTIESAMLVLKTEGLIEGRQGKGVFVARPEEAES
ncbi:MAG TPA: winged helix-turn-helix domain-containing protein [Asanoa sp.]|jgi:GntR family transcriptional regulator